MAITARHSISVVFPAYNEEENIGKAVEQAVEFLDRLFPDWEVIVVNDGSRDATGEIIDKMAVRDRRVIALHHERNLGYGAALRTGIQNSTKELIFFSDSDLQFHMNELLMLLMWIEQYDIVIGYRAPRRDPVHRKLNAFGWKMLVRALLGLKVRDIDCAFKLFRREVFSAIRIDAVGAMVNSEILVKAVKMGFKIKEVPVTHFRRLCGTQTGASIGVILKAFRELSRLYVMLRGVEPVIRPYDRREESGSRAEERRRHERRSVMLPINFEDRRRRVPVRRGEPLVAASSDIRGAGRDAKGPLTVAMVVASPFPANHGTPAGIKELAAVAAARGHRVHIVSYHFGEGTAPRDVTVHRGADPGFGRKVRVGPSYDKPILDLLLLFKLIRVIVREQVDVVHGHNYEGALVGYLASRITRRPFIYNAVNTMGDELATYNFFRPKVVAVWLARFLDYWVPRMADRVICISDELARFVLARGIRPERIATIPLGIEFEAFNGRDGGAIRQEHGLGEDPLVMYTGTLDRFQRIDYLLKAMRFVVDRVSNARLLIVANVASTEDLRECQEATDRLDLGGHVKVITGTPFGEIPAFLAAADVAVVPRPACPGFPVKLLNYMAARKPIVVFKGSAKGLKHLETAIVVEDHDWQGMGQGIVALFQDPEGAEELGRNARRWAEENLSWSTLVGKVEDVYYEVCEGRGGRARARLAGRGMSLYQR